MHLESFDTSEARRQHEGSKVRTVLRITMRTTPIPVTVGTFEVRRQHEGPKVTTVTRMEALRLQKRRQLRGSRP